MKIQYSMALKKILESIALGFNVEDSVRRAELYLEQQGYDSDYARQVVDQLTELIKESSMFKKYSIVADPSGHYGIDTVMGMAENLNIAAAMMVHGDGTIKENLEKNYPFGVHWASATVDDAGVFTFAGDPPLYPLMRVVNKEGQDAYFYPHDIVTLLHDGQWMYGRID